MLATCCCDEFRSSGKTDQVVHAVMDLFGFDQKKLFGTGTETLGGWSWVTAGNKSDRAASIVNKLMRCWLRARLSHVKFRKVHCTVTSPCSSPVLVFTDGACEPSGETFKASVGGVLIDLRTHVVRTFGAVVPECSVSN